MDVAADACLPQLGVSQSQWYHLGFRVYGLGFRVWGFGGPHTKDSSILGYKNGIRIRGNYQFLGRGGLSQGPPGKLRSGPQQQP